MLTIRVFGFLGLGPALEIKEGAEEKHFDYELENQN
tara:strand:+ start:18105 stop:18212 length:108 start_codon:yes stop_codon:yes gene_type:complete